MFTDSCMLLNCHGWEDFPTHFRGQDAASLWACYTSLWHPIFLANRSALPRWVPHDAEFDPPLGSLVLIPTAMSSRLTENQRSRLSKAAKVIEGPTTRREIIESLGLCDAVSKETADRFFALGYAFWQLQLMTRQVRFGHGLDETQFFHAVAEAAQASLRGDKVQFQSSLGRAYDLLLSEKNRFYVSQPRLLDLTIISPEVSEHSLSRQIERRLPRSNWLINAGHFLKLPHHSQLREWFREEIDHGRIQLLGGLIRDWPHILLGTESLVREFRDARQMYLQDVGFFPNIFARRCGGLHAQLPQFLRHFEFQGALHARFDGSILARTGHELIEWESPSGDSVPAIALEPADASVADTFISLGLNLGKQLNSAHQATMLLAHWPDHYHVACEDLVRVTQESKLLGAWVLADEVLTSAYHPGYGDAFACDEYWMPILEYKVRRRQEGPISIWIDYWNRLMRCLALEGLAAMLESVTLRLADARHSLQRLRRAIDDAVDNGKTTDHGDEIEQKLTQLEDQLLDELTRAIGAETGAPSAANFEIRFNPTGRRVAEVPAWGYQCRPVRFTKGPTDRGKKHSLIWSHGLRNDHFEVEIDQRTGGILAVRLHNQRGNIASQRLAIRLIRLENHSRENDREPYAESTMEHWEAHVVGEDAAQAISRGSFQCQGESLGRFEQRVRIERTAPLIRLEFDVELGCELSANPWREYLCTRLAWQDATARRYADQLEARHQVRWERFTAPLAIDIENDVHRLTWLPGGACFHRQSAPHILDTLLVVAGEHRRSFRMAMAVNQQNPFQLEQSLLCPPWSRRVVHMPRIPAARFYSLKPGHIVVWRIDALSDERGRVTGATWWLRESKGSDGQLEFDAPRPIASAVQLDMAGRVRQLLTPDDFRVTAPFRAFDIFGIQINWKLYDHHD